MSRRWIGLVLVAFGSAACGTESGLLTVDPTATPPAVTLAPLTPAPEATETPETTETPEATETPGAETPEPTSSLDGTQGIYGSVKAGPTCPVESASSPCPDRPVADATVTASSGGAVVGTTTTNAQGEFRLSLAPGSYSVTASSKSVQGCNTQRVEVKDHNYHPVRIDCDTGIR